MLKIMKTHILSGLIVFTVAWMVVTMETPYGLATTPDSLSYLDMAANIHNDHGALVTDFALTDIEDRNYIEQRLWPILYPLALSLFVEKLSNIAAAATLSKILLFITLLLVYIILSRYIAAKWLLLVTLPFGLTTPVLTIYSYAWSETLFIPLMLFSAWLAICYLDMDNNQVLQKNIVSVLLLISLVALLYTRYIGIIFFLLIPLLFILSKKGKNDLVVFIIMILIYVGVAAYMLFDNYNVTGSISGGIRKVSDKTISQNFEDCFSVLEVMTRSAWIIYISTFVVLAIIALVISLSTTKNNIIQSKANVKTGVIILSFFALLYFFSIVIFRTISYFDALDVRLLSPAFPFIWMILSIGAAYFIASKKYGSIGFVVVAFFLVLLTVNGYQQLLRVIDNWHKYDAPKHAMSKNGEYKNFTFANKQDSLKNIIHQLISDRGVILAVNPLILEFIVDKKSMLLPSRLDFPVLDKINRLPVGSLLIFDNGDVDPFRLIKGKYTVNYTMYNFGDIVIVKTPIIFTEK